MLDQSLYWIPTPGFNKSSLGESTNTPVLSVCQYSLFVLAMACLLGVDSLSR